MRRGRLLALAAALVGGPVAGADVPAAISATTAAGETVWLHPSGRWEYADPARAREAARVAAGQPDRLRRADAQGGWLGLGREVVPGDPDYNRGSLNPKLR